MTDVIPNLFIIGAPKCGTSALAHYLSEHPNVFFSDPKEPFFLSDDYPELRKQHGLDGIEDYFSLFQKADPQLHTVIAEGSTNYLASHTAIKNAMSISPDAKFIVMLRDPVQVAHAYHMEQIWARNEDEKSFEAAWRLQAKRKKGQYVPRSCVAEQFLMYGELTNFVEQIRNLYAVVERAKVIVLLQEELRNDPKAMYEKVLSFLNLPNDGRSEFPVINASHSHRYEWLADLVLRPPRFLQPVTLKIRRWARIKKPFFIEFIKRHVRLKSERHPLDENFELELYEHFRPMVEELESILERDLSAWKAENTKFKKFKTKVAAKTNRVNVEETASSNIKEAATVSGSKPRVLMITVRADHGGGPEHLYQVCMNLSERHTISIACPNDEPYADRFSSIQTLYKRITIPHRAISFFSFIKLFRFIYAEDIDVIHSHGKGAGIYGRLLAFATRRLSVHTFHGLHIGEYPTIRKNLYRLVEKLLWHLSDQVIAVSQGEAAEVLQFLKVSPTKLAVIPNGVVIPEETFLEKPGPVLNVISVSRYDAQKNPKALLEIARGIKARKAKVRIVVIGEGPLFELTRRTIIEEHLTDVIHLAGATRHPRTEMRKASVALSTSRWEGMPLALLEAMSEGLAIVASDVVGNNDIVTHGAQGYLFSVEDTDQAVRQLVALSRNSKQLVKLADNARQHARQQYSVHTMTAKVEQVYRRLLARSTSK